VGYAFVTEPLPVRNLALGRESCAEFFDRRCPVPFSLSDVSVERLTFPAAEGLDFAVGETHGSHGGGGSDAEGVRADAGSAAEDRFQLSV